MTQALTIFSPEDYCGPVPEQPNLSGQMGLTHLAQVRVAGRPRNCYIKTYLDNRARLANEIAGYCLARAMGVPVADVAGLIFLPASLLKILHGVESGPALGWVCSDLGGREGSIAKTVFPMPSDLNSFIDDLKSWPKLPGMLALDEWTANVDRNTGNLYRYGRGRYAVFDHGEMIAGGDWPSFQPHWNASYLNKILCVLEQKGALTAAERSATVMEAGRAEQVYQQALTEFVFFWSRLLTPSEFALAATFLECRARYGPARLGYRFGLIA